MKNDHLFFLLPGLGENEICVLTRAAAVLLTTIPQTGTRFPIR